MKIETEFDLFCWIKHYFWREAEVKGSEWVNNPWAKKWGSPLIALQEADISCARFAEVLAHEMWMKGFRVVEIGEGEEHF